MADVTIFSEDACDSNDFNFATHSQVFVNKNTGYQFYVDKNDFFSYKKTTDGGATWGSAVNIDTGAFDGFGVWFDKWTPGDSGSLIHIISLNHADWVVSYYNLNTSNDSVSCPVGVIDLTDKSGTLQPSWTTKGLDIVKARGGNLYVAAAARASPVGAFDRVFSRSTDGGSNWAARSDVYENTGSGNDLDRVVLQPGDETDNNDIWAMYFDDSAQAVSLKVYDDSANSWSETAIAGSIDAGALGASLGLDAAPRHSDNHSILVVWDFNSGAATEEFKAWDIGGSGSITGLTDPIAGGDSDVGVAVLVDQNNSNIYVVLGQAVCGNINAQDVYYVRSTDGGSTWDCPVQVSQSCEGRFHDFWTTVSVASGGGGRLLVAWGDRGNDDLLTNKVNSVALGVAAAVPRASIATRLMELDLI